MAQNPKQPILPANRKHLARQERERQQARAILIAAIAVGVLVVGLVAYGVLDQTYLRARQPVAVVNGEQISTEDFQAQVRYGRYSLIQNAFNTYQFMQMFGSDPSTQSSFVGQLQQIQGQMEPSVIGQTVLNQMIDNKLILQEAKKRGITVTPEELDKAFEEAFGYYPNGTPTASPTVAMQPTSTLNALQMTLVPPTATPTETALPTETVTTTEATTATVEVTPEVTVEATLEVTATEQLTPTATPLPEPTATPYTEEGYQKLYQDTVTNFQTQYNIQEKDLRYLIEMEQYRNKVRDAILAEQDIARTEEQVWARHILVADEETAKQVIERLNQGETFQALAAELSTDTSNSASGGDLGWFGKDRMVAPFAEAAFALEVGQISQPVQTDFGWHVIQVLGHEDRPLTDSEYEAKRDAAFSEWLTAARAAATIETRDYWTQRVPLEPTMPAEITQLIDSINAAQSQPQVTLPVELPQETPEAPAATPVP